MKSNLREREVCVCARAYVLQALPRPLLTKLLWSDRYSWNYV